MAKPYDAATKRLMELHPQDWVDFLQLPTGPLTLLDVDLSTITAAADRLIRVDANVPYVLHNEFESGKDTSNVPFRLLQYSVNAKAKFGLPVVSTVFLLHKDADSPQITGHYQEIGPDGTVYTTFVHRVVRVWLLDVETLLSSGISLLPFAPIAKISESDLPGVISRMEARIEAAEIDDATAGDLWTATYVLLGLRYNKAFNAQLLKGVRRMKESVTYQAIIEEGIQQGIKQGIEQGIERGLTAGKFEEARRLIVRAGTKRLGPIPASVETALSAIDNLEQLESYFDRIAEVESWEELITTL